ncbi:MAG: hypothetical protein C4308_05470 [Chitinophagaceae bacterium]
MLKLNFSKGILTISAEKEKEEKEEFGRFNRREYYYSSWRRSFTMPPFTDMAKVEALYEHGELKIIIPKTEVKERKMVKTIKVS